MESETTHYALFRLPDHQNYVRMVQRRSSPARIDRLEALGRRRGFVFAPFAADDAHPVWLLEPDEVTVQPVPEAAPTIDLRPTTHDDTGSRAEYLHDFATFHQQVSTGRYAKLVLARSLRMTTEGRAESEALFVRACQMYPHLYVALVSIPEAGTWLMATPEVLIESDDQQQWHTMALAGTMREATGGDPVPTWSDKNRQEQHYVSAYIADVLHTHATQVASQGPYTTHAARLVHLRTDFTFRLGHARDIGPLIAALHPTPAVCGMPKEEALRFITGHESRGRRYYSGFCGPLGMDMGTHLYVSLRCMELAPHHLRLYAGGGILPESTPENEWGETQAKMQTMLGLMG